MVKPCNQTSPKAVDPGYECNPKTGRWNKKKAATKPTKKKTGTKAVVAGAPKKQAAPDTFTVCQKRLLEELGIRIPKGVKGTKVLFATEDVAKFNPERLRHEMVKYGNCYFHFSWIPKNALTLKNKLWKGVKSYRDLVAVTLRFMDLFPPLYPLPHRAKPFTFEQSLPKLKERQENKNQLSYFAQILMSFVKTFERMPQPSLPMPTASQLNLLSGQLRDRGILPFRSFTMETHPDVSTHAIEKILHVFKS